MSTHKMLIAGFGGQGVMLIGQMITYAGMYEGKEVTWMPSYGPEMRGGTANCSVIVSDKKISSPVIAFPTSLVAMNTPSLTTFEDSLLAGGDLILNSSIIDEESKRTDVNIYKIDSTAISDSLNNPKVANMVLLGAIVAITNIVSLDSIEKVMAKNFTGKKAALLPLNKEALHLGANFILNK